MGLFKNSPAVQGVLNFADQWNLHESKDFRVFKAYVSDYFDAKTNAEMDSAARVLVEYSKNLLHEWNASGIKKDKQAKFKRDN